MFEVYFINAHEVHFFKSYRSERAAEIALMTLRAEGIKACWIEETC